ncbi:uncharacterized protein LOC143281011 isoform X2 [Babylonia areolata]|uniref:uncharacterized protein LOC143281011 isoform X2 n=1 Tax=Babylonia areolata TaxID=304850 RepID=UPI003FD37036
MRRARTSFDFYEDRMREDAMLELPELPMQGRQNPMDMVRPSSPGGPGGHMSRPRSRGSRPPMTARSYTDMGMQASNDYNPYTDIDPVNKHYYYRLWRKDPPRPQRPIYREGRLGSPWRHIKACINNAGNHLVFIDGTIKSEENHFYPPETMFEPPNFSLYISPRLAPTRRQSSSVPARRGGSGSVYLERAKQGFKYWPQEQKPIDLASRYRQKAKMLTLGVSCSN